MVRNLTAKNSSLRGWMLWSIFVGACSAVVAYWLQFFLLSGASGFSARLIALCIAILVLCAAVMLGERTSRRQRAAQQLAATMQRIHQELRADGERDERLLRVVQILCAAPQLALRKKAILVTQSPGLQSSDKGAWAVAVTLGESAEERERSAPCAALQSYLETPSAALGEILVSAECFCRASSQNSQKIGIAHGHYLVPLVYRGQVEGGLALDTDSQPGADASLRTWLQALGALLGGLLAEERSHEAVQRLTFYDPLTDLPNRRLLLDRIQQAFTNAQSSRQWGAVIFLDLDHFKPINDIYGHAAGDVFLRTIGQRLAAGLRRRDTVARYGGDEFVILMEDLGSTPDVANRAVERVAQKVRALVSKTVAVGDGEASLSASLGIAVFPAPDQAHAEEVLRQADIALYRSKELGRDDACIFVASMAAEFRERRAFDQPLRGALERNEFSLYLQAKTNARGQITGAEVLLRWQHPGMGLVAPEIFIPLAEESGTILALGEWVLRQSCILLAQTAHLGVEYSLSVNVSPRQLRQSGFVAILQAIMQETGAPASRLTLEVTEGLFLSNMDHVISILKELRELGVRISIDDFGTGYSCLFYLQKLPLDELKIDQSFVQSSPKEPGPAVLIDAILAISRQLGLDVVAEGVESKAQLDFLVDRGCTLFQGYYFGQPQPVLEFLAALDSRPLDSHSSNSHSGAQRSDVEDAALAQNRKRADNTDG